jgi:hypothetical protein
MFEVSGNPECVWLEGDGIKFILVLDFWNDYAAAFEGKKVVFQFQGEAKADGDVCLALTHTKKSSLSFTAGKAIRRLGVNL